MRLSLIVIQIRSSLSISWTEFIIVTKIIKEIDHNSKRCSISCELPPKFAQGKKKAKAVLLRELISIQYPSGEAVTFPPTNGTINQGKCIVQSSCFRCVQHTEVSGAEPICTSRQGKKHVSPHGKTRSPHFFLDIVLEWPNTAVQSIFKLPAVGKKSSGEGT